MTDPTSRVASWLAENNVGLQIDIVRVARPRRLALHDLMLAAIADERKRIALVTTADRVTGDLAFMWHFSPSLPAVDWPRARLSWPTGAVSEIYSVDDPAALRGPQHDFAIWAAPLPFFRSDHREAWDTLMFGLRLGRNPRAVLLDSTGRYGPEGPDGVTARLRAMRAAREAASVTVHFSGPSDGPNMRRVAPQLE
jgi:phage terminase large subunit-like protein